MVTRKKRKSLLYRLLVLPLLFLSISSFSQASRTAKINDLYHCLLEYHVECPKTVLAIVVYETGWLECKNCSYQFNNLFGFRANGQYLKFKSIYECLEYFKVWQETYYLPWKNRHPDGTYYQYLVHVKYAHKNIGNYLTTIKSIERLISKNVSDVDATLISDPGAFQEIEMDTLKYGK
jgi:hypothetical protein